MEYGEELRRVAYVITRGGEEHYEAVFDQMDLYVRSPRVSAVSIRPNAVGSTLLGDLTNQFLRCACTAVVEA
mgnify:CR=1 FL=1